MPFLTWIAGGLLLMALWRQRLVGGGVTDRAAAGPPPGPPSGRWVESMPTPQGPARCMAGGCLANPASLRFYCCMAWAVIAGRWLNAPGCCSSTAIRCC